MTVQDESEFFLHLHALDLPPFSMHETELQYQGLGAALQSVRLTNLRRLVHELRTRAPSSPFDERLAATGGRVNVLGGILPADLYLDVALAVLARYHHSMKRA